MARVDYDNGEGPAPNALVVASSAVVTDETGRIVLHRRVDNSLWALPGGAIELGESVRDGTVREVREETGLDVVADYVIAVYSDPAHVMAYDDGEVRQEFSVCVKCHAVGGALRVSEESHEVRWFRPAAIGGLRIHPRILVRITDYLDGTRAALSP